MGGDMVPVGQLYTRGYLLQNKRGPSPLPSHPASLAPAAPAYSGLLAVDYGPSKSLTAGFFVAQVPDALARGDSYGGFSTRSAFEGFSVACRWSASKTRRRAATHKRRSG